MKCSPLSGCPRVIRKNRNGAMLVLVAVVMIILFVASALAIDIAYMHATRAELRTATDAASRAASEALGRLQSTSAATEAAFAVASANTVAGSPLSLAVNDIEFGTHVVEPDGRFRFVPGGSPLNTVRIVGRRTTGSPSGPIPLFFGPIFGQTTFQPIQQATSCRLDRDIALVLDVSGSMADFGRFQALTNALTVFLSELSQLPQDELLSLTVYSTTSQKQVAMTNNFLAIQKAFSTQSPGGSTAIGEGIQTGIDSILNDPGSRPFIAREIVVMTDGNHNTGIDPLTVVPQAVANNITIHAVTFSQGANQPLMQQIAQATGGIHLHATTNQELIDVFRQIASRIPVILID